MKIKNLLKGVKMSNEAKEFNFRETDNDDNCSKCNRFDKKSFDEFEANCKFFNIKTDENHICDLLQPQLEEESISNQTEDVSQKRGYYFIVIGFIALVISLLNLQTLLISHSTTKQILLIIPGILFIFIGRRMVKEGEIPEK